jgi:predicted nucleic acid-binding protein
MKVVLDSNVFISSFLSLRGPPRRIVDLWKDGRLTWCLCAEILDGTRVLFRAISRILEKARWQPASPVFFPSV